MSTSLPTPSWPTEAPPGSGPLLGWDIPFETLSVQVTELVIDRSETAPRLAPAVRDGLDTWVAAWVATTRDEMQRTEAGTTQLEHIRLLTAPLAPADAPASRPWPVWPTDRQAWHLVLETEAAHSPAWGAFVRHLVDLAPSIQRAYLTYLAERLPRWALQDLIELQIPGFPPEEMYAIVTAHQLLAHQAGTPGESPQQIGTWTAQRAQGLAGTVSRLLTRPDVPPGLLAQALAPAQIRPDTPQWGREEIEALLHPQTPPIARAQWLRVRAAHANALREIRELHGLTSHHIGGAAAYWHRALAWLRRPASSQSDPEATGRGAGFLPGWSVRDQVRLLETFLASERMVTQVLDDVAIAPATATLLMRRWWRAWQQHHPAVPPPGAVQLVEVSEETVYLLLSALDIEGSRAVALTAWPQLLPLIRRDTLQTLVAPTLEALQSRMTPQDWAALTRPLLLATDSDVRLLGIRLVGHTREIAVASPTPAPATPRRGR